MNSGRKVKYQDVSTKMFLKAAKAQGVYQTSRLAILAPTSRRFVVVRMRSERRPITFKRFWAGHRSLSRRLLDDTSPSLI